MTKATNVQFFEYQGSHLAYRVFGNGPTTLLAFHGFGQDGNAYQSLEASIGDRYAILAVDLFFHGSSHHSDCQLLTKTDWQGLVDAFLRQRGIHRFSLIGFSLGGRFALATVEMFASRIDRLILIAPDGIRPSFWYQLATHSGVGRALFRYGLRHVSVLSTVGHALTWLGLLNRTVMRFVQISLGTPEQRNLVYLTWTQFRLISPDLTTVSRRLNEQAIEVLIFTGFFDRIVPAHWVLPLTKRLQRYELTVLKTGHTRLIELTAERLAQRPLYDLP